MTALPQLILLLLGITLGMPTAAHPDEIPYVTTPAGVVDAMLSIAKVGEKDYLIDLGSGDGRIVIAAAKEFHARGVGIELDGTLVAQSRESAARAGVSDRVDFHQRHIHVRLPQCHGIDVVPAAESTSTPSDGSFECGRTARPCRTIGTWGIGSPTTDGCPDVR